MSIKFFYPGWTRKAITFTIDDGNIEMDKKFISIVKPNGISGTFNLCSLDLNKYTPDFYREMYSGFGIANHCKMHPFLLKDSDNFELSNDAFDEATADEAKFYKTSKEGVYRFRAANGWRRKATLKAYTELISECHEELEGVFGKGSVTSFVWPFGDQQSTDILEYINLRHGYTAARKTGLVEDSTGFAVPSDRMYWSYNASHKNLLECAEKYDKYADDGELKFFSFGIHSIDYENAEKWNELREFAKKYGNRKNDFYYAPVDDIFRYADATKEVKTSENEVINPTNIEIYAELNGIRTTIAPKSSVVIEK